MNIWPLKFRETGDGRLIFADDTGAYFRSLPAFLDRYVLGRLDQDDIDFLEDSGYIHQGDDDLDFFAYASRWAMRQTPARPLSYVILVPTLRCNLACRYCQVSRAAESAEGFDWTEETLTHVLRFLNQLSTPHIKVEFQGGEPLLRVDLLERVRDFCRTRFVTSDFVVCTNLQRLGEREWGFLDAADTHVSTSLDATLPIHQAQRTFTAPATETFVANLTKAVAKFGKRISALPTIDLQLPPKFSELIANFRRFGFTSIYLRPVNHHGFARRNTPVEPSMWASYYTSFIEHLIEHNYDNSDVIEEYYFSQCLRRVLRPSEDSHVDLRNPNHLGQDYIVVDYDGRLFPTDEARMLYRIGQIDLSIGDVVSGLAPDAIAQLNASSLNNFDPDCLHCPYQAFCGSDLVDDISRYGRIDIPRSDTWFCRRQLTTFDLIFDLIYRRDPKTNYSLARWAGLETFPAELAPSHT